MSDSANVISIERVSHTIDGLRSRHPSGDQFGDHRIVEHRDLTALEDTGIHPNMCIFRRSLIAHQPADGRHEIAQRVFRIDPRLDRPSRQRYVCLRNRQFLSGRTSYHQFHEIEPRHIFRHRMLHLQAGIHFEKEEVSLGIDNELDSTGGAVIHRLCQSHGLSPHPFP